MYLYVMLLCHSIVTIFVSAISYLSVTLQISNNAEHLEAVLADYTSESVRTPLKKVDLNNLGIDIDKIGNDFSAKYLSNASFIIDDDTNVYTKYDKADLIPHKLVTIKRVTILDTCSFNLNATGRVNINEKLTKTTMVKNKMALRMKISNSFSTNLSSDIVNHVYADLSSFWTVLPKAQYYIYYSYYFGDTGGSDSVLPDFTIPHTEELKEQRKHDVLVDLHETEVGVKVRIDYNVTIRGSVLYYQEDSVDEIGLPELLATYDVFPEFSVTENIELRYKIYSNLSVYNVDDSSKEHLFSFAANNNFEDKDCYYHL